jgi:hypothetical protein
VRHRQENTTMSRERIESDPEFDAARTGNLDTRRETLEFRLEDGFRRIDEAALAGADVTEWETFWIRLLHEYEGVCRELEPAA